MATLPYIIFVSLLCLHLCNSNPQPNNVNIKLATFVLDGKNDCKIADTNKNVMELFKSHQCPEYIKAFSESYFDQREVLPCLGIYDALYHLCEFPENNMDIKTPELFIDSNKFCVEAKRVYSNLNFSYNGIAIKKWSNALNKTMQDKKRCENMCLIDKIVNDQCIAMLTFANEYLRLIEIKSTEKAVNAKTTNSKKITDSETLFTIPAANVAITDKTVKIEKSDNKDEKIHSSNITHPIEPTNAQKTPVVNTEIKQTMVPNEISKTEKTNVELPASSKIRPDANKVPNREETKVLKDQINVNNADGKTPAKTVEMKPSPETNNVQKINPVVSEDGLIDETERTPTSEIVNQDHLSAATDNEEVDPRDKGFVDEEIDKPIKEEKIPIQETEQGNSWSEGQNEFNPIRGSLSESEDSYSFTYIITTMAALCAVYLLFHYRNKLMALALEGRKGRSSRGRGRPSSANYSKLHSNLEEAIASNVTAPSATHVLY